MSEKLRYAIMGASDIANKFCNAVSFIPEAEIVAVANRTFSKAKDFAERNKIPAVYDNFEKMIHETSPDCVYIAVTQNAHKQYIDLCIKNHINVLCEKAMYLNSKDALDGFARGKSAGIFMMEAMWSRFLPPVVKAKEWVKSGKIGDMCLIDFAIGFNAPSQPGNRFFEKANGGSTAWDLSVYGYMMSDFFTETKPVSIKCDAIYNEEGVDTTNNIALNYGKITASVKTSFTTRIKEEMTVYGNKGRIVIPSPHFATKAILYDNDFNIVEEFTDTITPNGFYYEAKEAMECVKAGKLESSVVPHSLSIASCEMYDLIIRNS